MIRECLIHLYFMLQRQRKDQNTHYLFPIWLTASPHNKRAIIKCSAWFQEAMSWPFLHPTKTVPVAHPNVTRCIAIQAGPTICSSRWLRLMLSAKWTRWEPAISGQHSSHPLYFLVWLYQFLISTQTKTAPSITETKRPSNASILNGRHEKLVHTSKGFFLTCESTRGNAQWMQERVSDETNLTEWISGPLFHSFCLLCSVTKWDNSASEMIC